MRRKKEESSEISQGVCVHLHTRRWRWSGNRDGFRPRRESRDVMLVPQGVGPSHGEVSIGNVGEPAFDTTMSRLPNSF